MSARLLRVVCTFLLLTAGLAVGGLSASGGTAPAAAAGLLSTTSGFGLVEPERATVDDDGGKAAASPPVSAPAPGLVLRQPDLVHATGPVLTWSAYVDPSSATADDLVEYQIFRGCTVLPAPGADNGCTSPVGVSFGTGAGFAAEAVGSVANNALTFTDVSAVASTVEDAATYRYWVVVRTVADVANGRNGYQSSNSVLVTTPPQ